MAPGADSGRTRLTFLQRRALRGLAKVARKNPGEPLGPEDWGAYWAFGAQPSNRAFKKLLRSIPSSPRCGYCGAPFAGPGKHLVGPLGYRPSRKNPNLCSVCVELAPPGGMTLEAGVLFCDLRGFTTLSEGADPAETSALLRRFYGCAEKVLFPEALIDKVIGDEVMALYIPPIMLQRTDMHDLGDAERGTIAAIMLRHARALLERIGYGSADGPFAEAGIGLDFGEVFIGNIGDTAVHDFTAIGDVVNTASRLQGHAAGGEIIASARLAQHLDEPLGPVEALAAKGKAEPVPSHRVTWAPGS
ncbi:MAG: adenylate cyclase [Solirubrobacteraceae bacterium]|nr:adenylate cyclase [Solirubrobacteraceae bacterium]